MLLKFKVGNFRSFDDVEELSLAPGATRAHEDHIHSGDRVQILKNSVIYGANAAGKTSFIKAMDTSRQMILGNFFNLPNLRRMYCRTRGENRSRPTYFEYCLEVDGGYYSYGFEAILSEGKYVSEWLIRLDPCDPGSEELIFERDPARTDEFRYGDLFRKDELQRLAVYGLDLSGNYNTLFLSEMNRKNFGNSRNLNILKDVFNWFVRRLMVNTIEVPDKSTLRNAGKILGNLGTDVSNLSFRAASDNDLRVYDPLYLSNMELALRNNAMAGGPTFLMDLSHWTSFELVDGVMKISKVYTKHSSSDSEFDIEEESSGTVQTLSLISLLTSDKDDMTYVMDEFGNAMHPVLATEFMRMFQRHDSDRRNQLVVATHLLSLMTLDLFRRDEIWFVDKVDGTSRLYSLEDFRERFDKKLDKAYLEGRYGALPLIRDGGPRLQEERSRFQKGVPAQGGSGDRELSFVRDGPLGIGKPSGQQCRDADREDALQQMI